MKLLLDAHHSPKAAARLRVAGYDVLAAVDDAVFRSLPNEDLLRVAVQSQRVLVTENAKDFDRIVRAFGAAGDHHAGVVFTSPRRYHRGSSTYPANLVKAFRMLLDNPPPDATDWVHWLD